MAPETIISTTVNEKTDMWGLGVTMYEMCTLE